MGTPTRWQSHGRFPYLLARLVLVASVLVVVFGLAYRLRVVAIPVLFAAALAFVLHPFADFLAARRVPRPLAAGVVVFLAVVSAAAVVLLVLPMLLSQLADLAARVPAMLEAAAGMASSALAEHLGVEVRLDADALIKAVQAHASALAAPGGWLIENLFQSLVTLVLAAVNTVIVVVLTFYLVESHGAIAAKAMDLIPPRWRPQAQAIVRAVEHALSAFIRGQVTVCILMAALYAGALTLVGIEGGATIGVLTGLANFVPYLGLATGLSLSLLSIALNDGGVGQLVGVLATYSVLPLLDASFITPKVVGDRTGLNPFVVIISLLIGAELMGPLGLLLALPTAAVLRALLGLWLASYRRSRFYLGDDPAE